MVAPYDFQEVIPRLPTRTFADELTFDVGGRRVELIQVGPAHTQGDVLVYVPDAKTLYSGDILFIGSTPVMWAGPVENWLAALNRILLTYHNPKRSIPVSSLVRAPVLAHEGAAAGLKWEKS
jgi:glyoxylase-like metal-dependent hydrolase (beta-lactamase superfamily II)